MGIDVETWRARIGLYHAASVGRHLKKQHKAAGRGRPATMSQSRSGAFGGTLDTLLHILVTCLLALLYTDLHFVSPYLNKATKFHNFDQKVLGFISSGMNACRGVVMKGLTLPKSTLVALSLLLIISGDVELNPGPVKDLNIKNLTNALSKVQSKWHDIGIQLGIDVSLLKRIENDFRGQSNRELSEMLSYWLDGNTETQVTWKTIIDALESSSVNENGLAQEIKTRYCQSTDDTCTSQGMEGNDSYISQNSQEHESNAEPQARQGEFAEEYDQSTAGPGTYTKKTRTYRSKSMPNPNSQLDTSESNDLHHAVHRFYDQEKEFKCLVTSKEANTLCKDKDGLTPLHLACKLGSLIAVRILVKELMVRHYDTLKDVLTTYTKDGSTPLHLASFYGHLDIVQFLTSDPELNCDPNFPAKDDQGLTPLNFAAREGHLDIVKYLIEKQKCDPMAKTKTGNTPLHDAAEFGHLDTVKYLVEEQQCDPMVKTNTNNTPLHNAAQFGLLKIVKYLVEEQKCDPKAKTDDNNTPLHNAAQFGCLEMVKYLVEEQQCDPMVKTNDEITPLHNAAQFGHLEVVKYLVETHHCNPFQKGFEDAIPLHLACKNGHLEVVKYLLNGELLKEHGIVIEDILEIQREKYGCAPIHLATYYNHFDVVKYLIEDMKCDPNIATTELKMTCLHFASRAGYIRLVKYLVTEQNCDRFIKNTRGNSGLHLAAREGNISVVKFFIETGSYPHTKGQEGHTPLEMARQKKEHKEVAEYLEQF